MSTQESIRYTLKLSGETKFEVVEFNFKEHLSYPFVVNLSLISKSSNPNFNSILDNPATLSLWQAGKVVRHINGIVTQLKQGKTGVKSTYYTLRIEPALSRGYLIQDSRHFQNKTAIDIITEVLKQSGVEHLEFHNIRAGYKPQVREFCQQYRETNLAFVMRLAAEEGFYYYFTHTEDTHILHFSNSVQVAPNKGTLLYNANPAGLAHQAFLTQANYQENIASTTLALKDYNFTNPNYRLNHKSQAKQNEVNNYEFFDSPGRYKFDEAGKPFTQTRLEVLRRETTTLDTEGDDMRMIPGVGFNLEGHPSQAVNNQWMITQVTHQGYQEGVAGNEANTDNKPKPSLYTNTARLIPWTVEYKADTQHKPIVDGPQIATVVGPKDEEIYCDEWGRVKLQFEYDRYGEFNELSSCWIRVSQGWAGTQFGAMAIPRIGQEVIVDYLEGDPDQPIITGRTYNANNLPPYPLPANKTRTLIKTNTHKGKGFNELRFEDENNQQEIFIHAQKDQNNIVLNNETTKVGVDRSEDIGQNETINIGKNRTESVGNDETISIANNRTENVGNDEALEVGNNQSNTIGNSQSNTIGKNQVNQIGKDQVTNIDNSRKLDVYADQTITSGGHYSHTVGGKTTWKSGEKISFFTTDSLIEAKEKIVIKSSGGTIIIDGGSITLKGKVSIKGSLAISGGGAEVADMAKLRVNTGKPFCLACYLKSIQQG
jgi:type VI secretion system secreted protein VgrG